ncbi:MAG: Asp-tRNA(Asn)/Glu-tRNA(Gln) amidotransferase subunit GatB [Verrucomicrobiales bacterium]|nr:Asp-tRNA(Asn)/Glu-tRNA(Gln) amidotransferase subunit GatB [Verrucomicrobiales bacterium]MED5586119.1 Asp-tRNA(Asn)/Glu-tRNA(Gln) amidotransferase subunit GatB [Verrucomicrobiota bacterium]
MEYITTIGLEVHVQLKTQSKMFCACPAEFGAQPNANTCPTCLGLPGALPVLNRGAIEYTVLAGMMLDCETPPVSKWDRKNYFYPDMPKNYQLSQFDLPLCMGGHVPLYDHCYPKDAQKDITRPGQSIGLTRIHLEEDVAKSTHAAAGTTIDFNRAGTPLMEIVSEPDIESPEEAFAYLNSLRQILIYGELSDADMEKGQMRCDVNVSVRPRGQEALGVKIELKNMNSVSAVRRALHYEIERQVAVLESGGQLVQSTRRWDDDLGETQQMRTKEDAHDYRYFPDPDLLPVRTADIIEKMRPRVPELPHQKAARFVEDFGISEYDASVISSDRDLACYFEEAAKESKVAKKIANWVINNVLAVLNDRDTGISQCPVKPASLSKLVGLVESGQLSNNQAKEVFSALFDSPDEEPDAIASRLGFEPADSGEIEALVDDVIAGNPDKVAEIRDGNDKLVNWLTGQVMKASRGKANARQVGDLLRSKIG